MSKTDGLPPTPPPVGPRPVSLTIASVVSLAVAGGLGAVQVLSPGMATKVPGMLGTVSSWISAGGIMGILALLVWLQLGNRKLSVEERNVDRVDEADLRDHWADELAKIRRRLDDQAGKHLKALGEVEERYRGLLQETEQHYKALLRESDEAHEECKRDRDQFRAEVAKLRNELDGLRRQFASQSADRVIALGKPGAKPPSSAVMGAARRVKRRLDRGADKKK